MPLPRDLFPPPPIEPVRMVLEPDQIPTKGTRHKIIALTLEGAKRCRSCGQFYRDSDDGPKPGRRGAMMNSDVFNDFVKACTIAWHRLDRPTLAAGRWAINLVTHWPRVRHLDVDVPHGDADASISAVLDACQLAGVVDNDVRIVETRTRNAVDSHRPRLEIEISQELHG